MSDRNETCRHCGAALERTPAGDWIDGGGFPACVKGGLWTDPRTGELHRRPAVPHTPLPIVEPGSPR